MHVVVHHGDDFFLYLEMITRGFGSVAQRTAASAFEPCHKPSRYYFHAPEIPYHSKYIGIADVVLAVLGNSPQVASGSTCHAAQLHMIGHKHIGHLPRVYSNQASNLRQLSNPSRWE
jgi:hypothetical protein